MSRRNQDFDPWVNENPMDRRINNNNTSYNSANLNTAIKKPSSKLFNFLIIVVVAVAISVLIYYLVARDYKIVPRIESLEGKVKDVNSSDLEAKIGTVAPNTSLSNEITTISTKLGSVTLANPITNEVSLMKSSLGIVGNTPPSVTITDKLASLETLLAPPKPSITSFSSTVEFFGDSIISGLNLPSLATQRASYIVCQAINKTEANYGMTGDMTQDLTKRVYNNHVSGNTCVILIGINDCIRLPNLTILDEYIRSLEATILYCCLPCANGTTISSTWKLTDTRNTNYVNKTGTWTNIADYNMGLVSNEANAYLQSVVKGRFVVFDVVPSTGSSFASHANITVTIDGVDVQDLFRIITKTTASVNNTQYCSMLFIYDTGVSGNHTLKVKLNTSSINLMISYMGAFDKSDPSSNQVLVCSSPILDLAVLKDQFNISNNLESTIVTYIRDNKKRLCHKFRKEYGLPVYFVDSGEPNISHFQNDLFHLNVTGNQYLANRILSVMNNGEY